MIQYLDGTTKVNNPLNTRKQDISFRIKSICMNKFMLTLSVYTHFFLLCGLGLISDKNPHRFGFYLIKGSCGPVAIDDDTILAPYHEVKSLRRICQRRTLHDEIAVTVSGKQGRRQMESLGVATDHSQWLYSLSAPIRSHELLKLWDMG